MKTIKLLIVASLLVFAAGCKKENRSYLYLFQINIQDAWGTELFEGIPLEGGIYLGEDEKRSGYIKSDLCQYNVIMSDSRNSVNKDGIPDRSQLFVHKMDEKHCVLLFRIVSNPRSLKSDSIKLELTCPYVFGDHKEHVVTTYWKFGSSQHSAEMYEVSLDGNFFPVTCDIIGGNPPIYTAWIVLDE